MVSVEAIVRKMESNKVQFRKAMELKYFRNFPAVENL